MKRSLALVSTLIALVTASAQQASAQLRSDATWSEAYFPSADGITKLHADILRPTGLAPTVKTPVVLTASPYTNHSGQTTDFDPQAVGPSNRFYDFLDLSQLLSHGYTYVMVDLPGFGGSGGCNDWGGNREQLAVKSAVEWAASRPWSTGKVALFGKSYDGWTGLMGIAQQPTGLAAVISMEPVYAGYNYLYNNGVRFGTSLEEAALFDAIDAKPGSTSDSSDYFTNGAAEAWCYGVNIALQQQDDPNSAFWRERNLLPAVAGATTPLFLTQGYLEDNTKPDAAFAFWSQMTGPKRAWFGQWDHCRPWETYGACKGTGNDQLALGKTGFVDEIMRFLDYYVKGVPAKRAPTAKDPRVEVQDSTGRFRPEPAWPPADSSLVWNALRTGTYTDDGDNNGTGSPSGEGVWTFSQPLPYTVRLAGEPVLNVRVDATAPNANLVADVYDVAPDGTSTLVSRGAQLLRGTGQQQATLTMYGEDWVFDPGHRIGVLISGANAEWWVHVPTMQDVTVLSSKIALPFLRYERTKFLDGTATPKLTSWLKNGVIQVTNATVTANQSTLVLPPKLRSR